MKAARAHDRGTRQISFQPSRYAKPVSRSDTDTGCGRRDNFPSATRLRLGLFGFQVDGADPDGPGPGLPPGPDRARGPQVDDAYLGRVFAFYDMMYNAAYVAGA